MVALSEQNLEARAAFLRDAAEQAIGTLSGDRCLMVGAGSGYNTEEFGDYFDEVNALEIEPREFPDVVDHGIFADGTRLPYQDDVFDLTVAISVIEHVVPPVNRPKLAEEMVRCTKPGGHVFFQIPNGRFPLELHTGLPLFHWIPGAKQVAIEMGYTGLKRVHIPSRAKLARWVREAGADVIEERSFAYPSEAIPKYNQLYEVFDDIGVFRVFPFGHIVVGRV
ncbi:class I SAM-dependent methyltransferase [Haloparvum sedimenti]|uniref:class I SAM-dependent methyltransferase n=1 Tax=Haloparvum sedimenti TaxID=1678448 RepID=UPI00071E970D|nr:class I SAM-dependent methyltransferase [Haloparvum sedimenti]